MIRFFKKIYEKFKLQKNRKNMLREYDLISYLINDSSTIEDFVVAKKRISLFKSNWDNEYCLKKLYRQYNYQLNNKRYYLSLYGIKKKKKER